MAVPTIYAKLIDDYDERMSKGQDAGHTKDYIRTCSSKIRSFTVTHLWMSDSVRDRFCQCWQQRI